MSDLYDKLRLILNADTHDLRSLANLIGEDPSYFYSQVALREADIRDQNLKNMKFRSVDWSSLLYNISTKVDQVYQVGRRVNDTEVTSPDRKSDHTRNFEQGGVEDLSPRERQVLRLVFRHLNSKEIGRELGISNHTVLNHVRKAKERLGVVNRYEAARMLHEYENIATAEDNSQAERNDLQD
jgi:DNA-binding CsgD family transcriptional regulator